MLAARIRAARRPRVRRPLAVTAAVLGALIGTTAPAQAADPAITVNRMGFWPSGQPSFYAHITPFSASHLDQISWRICDPECGDAVATGTNFHPETVPVGATVEASATIDGREISARTPVWSGVPTSTSPPGIAGELRIGRRIGPAPATWSGGWPDDGSVITYRLCRTASGDDCRSIQPATGSDRITIDPSWAGWYLGAVEYRFAYGTPFPALAYGEPAWGVLPTLPAPAPRPTLISGPLAGPIPPAAEGTPPTVPGTLAVGQTVRPRSGAWPDAPDDGAVRTGLRACPTRQDSDRCVAIHQFSGWRTPANGDRPEPGEPAVLSDRYLGWYVGAVDLRVRDVRSTAMPPLFLDDVEIPPPGPVVVHGPLNPTPVRLGFTPRATIRSRAVTHPTRRTTLATVRCQERCVARVTVVSGKRTTKLRLAVAKGKATRLTVPARATRGQRARVTIRFDHHPRTVRKTVRLV